MTSFINKQTVSKIMESLKILHDQTLSFWKSSRFFRITSIVTGSIIGSWFARILFIKYWRKFNNLPTGPYGLPFLGSSMFFADPQSLISLGDRKPAISMGIGSLQVVCMNNPYLIKRIYGDSRTTNTISSFNQNDAIFLNTNGPEWEKRRKIIFSNLMSTMNASFIEDASKAFIKNKIFPIFDEKIKQNESFSIKPLMRPLGFNIILHACFGRELSSLNDPFMVEMDKIFALFRRNQLFQVLLLLIFGGNYALRQKIEQFFGLESFDKLLEDLAEITEKFAMDEKNKVQHDEHNENLKFFSEYLKEYISNKENKLSRRKLFGDMGAMFIAATDTTYAALATSLLMAAKHPLIQDELHSEIVEAFGNNVDNITLDKGGILKIPKLRAFIHEILRIFPGVPVAGLREIKNKGFKIDTRPYGDNTVYDVPKGCGLMINIMAVHYNPKWWIKNYDPLNNKEHRNIKMNEIHFEFWLDKNGKFNKQQNSISFLTFSRGKRDCVGQALAIRELYIVLSMIFMKYKAIGPNGDDKFHFKQVLQAVMEPQPDYIRLQHRFQQ